MMAPGNARQVASGVLAMAAMVLANAKRSRSHLGKR